MKGKLLLSILSVFCLVSCDSSTHNHTFDTSSWEYDADYHWYLSTCGHDVQGNKAMHKYVDTVVKPTYETEGYTSHTCSTCGYSYIDSKVDKLEHHFSSEWSHNKNSHWHACIDAGYENLKKDESEHTFTVSVISPTYEFGGHSVHTCICGYSYNDNETSALEHHYASTLSYDESYHWYSCTDSGYEDLKKDNKQHNFNSVVTPPTGTSYGYTTHTCLDCGYSYIDNRTNPLTYTVIWKNWDGTILETDKNVSYGTFPSFDSSNPTKPHSNSKDYDFIGWDKEFQPVESDQVYIAQFEEIQTFEIKYNFNGGSSSEIVNSYKRMDEGYQIPRYSPIRNLYKFFGWYCKEESRIYKQSEYFEGNYDVEFYAMWESSNCSKCNGTGKLNKTCDVCNGVGSVICKNCNGSGWPVYYCNNCGKKASDIAVELGRCSYCGSSQGTVFRINYECPDCHGNRRISCSNCSGSGKIVYTCDACNGACRGQTLSAPTIAMKTATKIALAYEEGYEYGLNGVKWQSSPLFENLNPNTTYSFYQRKTDNSEPLSSVISNCIIVRTHEPYTITYLNAGSYNDNPSTYLDTDEFFLKNPLWDGYIFLGWYDEDNNQITYIDVGTTSNIVLTARWSTGKFNLSVSSNNDSMGTATIVTGTGLSNEQIIVKANPIGDYMFDGWYCNGEKVSEKETFSFVMPENDYLLEARFVTQLDYYAINPVISNDRKTIKYGLYPQTHVDDASIIEALNNISSPESNGWYFYNGDYYAKKTSDSIDDDWYKFNNGDFIEKNTEYWFKVEPIEWNVLQNDDNQYLVLSSILLDKTRYYHNSGEIRTIDGETIYPSNYEYSDIRAWLNTSFYNSAFFLGDDFIETTTVKFDPQDDGIYSYNDTQDKVFLLTKSDYTNAYYGFDTTLDQTSTRCCKVTDWIRVTGVYKTGYGTYWTRSPVADSEGRNNNDLKRAAVYYINGDGICRFWYFDSRTNTDYWSKVLSEYCVRPAITLLID